MAMVRYTAGKELTPEEHEAARLRIQAAAKRAYTYDPDCPLVKAETRKLSDLTPEQIERAKAALKRRAASDPGYEKLTLEEFINWHPVGGISWEERARYMEATGIKSPESKEQEAPQVFAGGK